MAKLIDADMLLELYDMGEELEEYAGVLSVPIPVIRQNIKDMPTVDAVEVVFCDNCVNHGNCFPETAFRIANVEKPYCCVGKMDGDGNV